MMNHFKFLSVSILFLLFSNLVFAAVPSDNEKLIEELTGKNSKAKIFKNSDSVISLSEQYLKSGRTALKQKDYILALKFFNTIIQKFPKSAEVQQAYLHKSKLYSMMGLPDQAELNYKLAEKTKKQIIIK